MSLLAELTSYGCGGYKDVAPSGANYLRLAAAIKMSLLAELTTYGFGGYKDVAPTVVIILDSKRRTEKKLRRSDIFIATEGINVLAP